MPIPNPRLVEATDRVLSILASARRLTSFSETILKPLLLAQRPTAGTYQAAMQEIGYRAYMWMDTLVKMEHPVTLQGAASAARGLFELHMDAEHLRRDPTLVAKYMAFSRVSEFDDAQGVCNFQQRYPDFPMPFASGAERVATPANRTIIEPIVEQHWGRTRRGELRWPSHWHGTNVRERAHQLGPEYESRYVFGYNFYCTNMHAGPMGFIGRTPESVADMHYYAHLFGQSDFADTVRIIGEALNFPAQNPGFERSLVLALHSIVREQRARERHRQISRERSARRRQRRQLESARHRERRQGRR